MREIKFRGKVKYNGKHRFSGDWVYGNLQIKKFVTYPFESSGIKAVDEWVYAIQEERPENGLTYRYESIEVYVETIGQYTGLRDINEKEIYEGDLLLFSVDEVYEVSIENYKFQLNGFYNSSFDNPNDAFSEGVFEIVGNIHDNPEWLEV